MRRTVILIVFLTFALGTSVEAQPHVSVRGNVGAAFFQSPDGLNNVLNSGVDLGLGAGIELYEGLEIVLQGSYDRFTLNGDNVGIIDEELTVESTVDGGDFDVLNGSIGLRYTLRNQSDAHPYVSGGVGIYRTVFARTRSDQGDEIFPRIATTNRGFHVAIGSTFRIDDTYAFFFEPRLVIVNTEDSELSTSTSTRYVTARFGVDLRL